MTKERSLSQGKLIWRRFKRHRIGAVGGITVLILVFLTVFSGFLGPYSYATSFKRYPLAPPTKIHFFAGGSLSWPFVYPSERLRDPVTNRQRYVENTSIRCPIRLFVRGDSYHFWGLFQTDVHLFGVEEPCKIFLFGSDKAGRDIFTRTLFGGIIDLSIGPLSLVAGFILGILIGGLSGYYGGKIDILIQRTIEVFQSFPAVPIWLALASALPKQWSSTMTFYGLVMIFSLLGWPGLARVIRGQFLALREMEFTIAAKASGASDLRIIVRHLLPNITSYLIVGATLSIPGAILGEATISFLGLGIKEPMTSWGLLLNQANSISKFRDTPWLLIPGLFIVVAVLAFNFLGDALRDAVDPYSVKGMH
ncbi:MAG: ABC transporter permease [Candidatus Acetothermia bacterium]|jgi:peptide/nickel transport system permease protein|nr:ABC transporter permease [Candidatus Acetothermia bacterium]MDH7504864.1 ABC transporter permease [Candidatus Acetothermia bacterium]